MKMMYSLLYSIKINLGVHPVNIMSEYFGIITLVNGVKY
jgi:hypothetical protein